MKTGEHILEIASRLGGGYNGKCSCRNWRIAAQTRERVREAHRAHFDRANAKEQAGS